MILLNDYVDGCMVALRGHRWNDEGGGADEWLVIRNAVEPLIKRIDELTARCRAAGIDVSDLED